MCIMERLSGNECCHSNHHRDAVPVMGTASVPVMRWGYDYPQREGDGTMVKTLAYSVGWMLLFCMATVWWMALFGEISAH
jgi:hypothetical protein